jgi:hypothetical protein
MTSSCSISSSRTSSSSTGGGHVRFDLEPDHPPEPPPGQLRLDREQQVVRLLLLDLEVGVAGDAERVLLDHLEPGEEPVEVGGDDLLERDEAFAVGQHDEAGQDRRHLDPREAGLGRAGVADEHGEVERQVGDVGERVGRVHRQRGQDREDLVLEDVHEVLAVVVVELLPLRVADPLLAERGDHLVAEHRGVAHRQLADDLTDRAQLLGRREPVGVLAGHLRGDLLLEAGHADLEELVEVGLEDRQELRPLEQREVRVLGEGQHALVELQPGQLPVEVAHVGLVAVVVRQDVERDRPGVGLLWRRGARDERVGDDGARRLGREDGRGGRLRRSRRQGRAGVRGGGPRGRPGGGLLVVERRCGRLLVGFGRLLVGFGRLLVGLRPPARRARRLAGLGRCSSGQLVGFGRLLVGCQLVGGPRPGALGSWWHGRGVRGPGRRRLGGLLHPRLARSFAPSPPAHPPGRRGRCLERSHRGVALPWRAGGSVVRPDARAVGVDVCEAARSER